MLNLEKRIEALEQASPDKNNTLVVIRFDEPEIRNQDVRRISTTTDFNEGETWTQLVGESGNDFTARVHKLVRGDRLGPILVFADHYAQD